GFGPIDTWNSPCVIASAAYHPTFTHEFCWRPVLLFHHSPAHRQLVSERQWDGHVRFVLSCFCRNFRACAQPSALRTNGLECLVALRPNLSGGGLEVSVRLGGE